MSGTAPVDASIGRDPAGACRAMATAGELRLAHGGPGPLAHRESQLAEVCVLQLTILVEATSVLVVLLFVPGVSSQAPSAQLCIAFQQITRRGTGRQDSNCSPASNGRGRVVAK